MHCHGGRANVRFLLDLLAAHGLHVCDLARVSSRTDPDPIRAAAAVALAEAPTARTAAILLDQYNGAFTAALDAILTAFAHNDNDMALTGLQRWRGGPASADD